MAHPTRIFNTPEDVKAAWLGYKENLTEQNKEWLNVQYVGKDGERKVDPMKVPMTLEGFKRYCRENHGEVQNYFDNTEGYYNEFYVICRAIKEEIRENQIIGGMLGVYNPSITQRLNNLAENTKNDNTHNIKLLNIDPLDDSADHIPPQNSGTSQED